MYATKLWWNTHNVTVCIPRSPTNINPNSQCIVWAGIFKHQAQHHVAAEYYVVFMTFKISRIYSRWRVCLYFTCIQNHKYGQCTSTVTMPVNIWCYNAIEHLLSQCPWTSTVTMPVNIYCHNVSVHLSQCQWTPTVTMSVNTYCHNASERLKSQCQCTSGVTMPVNIWCYNVSDHLLSKCQVYSTSGVTMPVNICHNVNIHLLS